MNAFPPNIVTANAITVFLDQKTVAIASDEPEYQPILDAIKRQDEIALRKAVATKLDRLKLAITASPSSGFVIENESVTLDGQAIDGSLAERIIQLDAEELPLEPLAAFVRNLRKSPSFRVVQRLYEFLEKGGIPITTDGHFVAYKAVRANWFDIHSGKFDNSIGRVVEVPRNEVDEDPDRTCSHGLHVCSYNYLPHFAHANGHVVVVKVNPADVVAIPRDYNDTKMRVSRYEVIDEVTDYYKKNEDVLRDKQIYDYTPYDERDDEDEDEDDDCWIMQTREFGSDEWLDEGMYDSYDNAVDAANQIMAGNIGLAEARVYNRVADRIEYLT